MAASTAFTTHTSRDVLVVRFVATQILDAPLIQQISSDLRKIVADPFLPKVILDVGEVRSLSSAMIGVLISLNAEAEKTKKAVVLAALRPELVKLLKMTRVDKLFRTFESQEKALNHFGVYGPTPAGRDRIDA